jgi:FAD:protein FMN transferase
MGFQVTAAACFILLASAGSGHCGSSIEKISDTSFHFDTLCTITIYGRIPDSHFDAVNTRVEEIEAELSGYDDESALSILNRQSGDGPVTVPETLFTVMKHGIAYSQLSDGAFDITVGPVQRLWKIGEDTAAVPVGDDIEKALDLVDFRKVVFLEPGERILLENRGMVIDLGGIAKGYAADKAVEVLKELGHNHALVNFGGNLVAIGNRPEGIPWRIGIPHPERSKGETAAIVTVTNAAVVTSGKYQRYFEEDGTRYHHIFDTGTGFPVENGLASVTIVTDSSIKADALSTAVFALGLRAGRELVEGFDGVEAVIITEDEKVFLTDGIRDAFILVDPRFSVME